MVDQSPTPTSLPARPPNDRAGDVRALESDVSPGNLSRTDEPGVGRWPRAPDPLPRERRPSIESAVRSYCRTFSAEFASASGSWLRAANGDRYLDFLSGCGSLNYGHNPPALRERLLEYIGGDGIAMSLDLSTVAKTRFLDALERHVLAPRGLEYRVQFPGPTGANAIEAAVKLARKVTGRHNVVAFTNAFHGCSLGALSLTGSDHHRSASAALLTNVTRMPYDGYVGDAEAYLERMLEDPSSGCDAPAALVLETVQGEGGVNVASAAWAQALERLARRHGALLIVDDIQAGCGRTGTFFSFESLGIRPDLVTMAKSISGFGLPLSIVLLDPALDAWAPGEHNGTFRGNNHAFVTAAAAIERFWHDAAFERSVQEKGTRLRDALLGWEGRHGLTVKGRGLMLGLDLGDGAVAADVQRRTYADGLIVETCGPHDEVVKLLPPLTVSEAELEQGLEILERALERALGSAVHGAFRRSA